MLSSAHVHREAGWTMVCGFSVFSNDGSIFEVGGGDVDGAFRAIMTTFKSSTSIKTNYQGVNSNWQNSSNNNQFRFQKRLESSSVEISGHLRVSNFYWMN